MPNCIAATEALFAQLVFSGYKHSFSKPWEVCDIDILALQIIPQDCFSSKKVCKPAWGVRLQASTGPHTKRKEAGVDFVDRSLLNSQNQVKTI